MEQLMDHFSDKELATLYNVKVETIEKKLKEDNWSDNVEDLIKSWGEKAAHLRWLHTKCSLKWSRLSKQFTVPIIICTTLTGVVNFSQESSNNVWLLWIMGSINILSVMMIGIKEFYNPEMNAQLHRSIAKQFGAFYRQIVLELTLPRSDRRPCNELLNWAKTEFDRMLFDSPHITNSVALEFNKKFADVDNKPDVIDHNYTIQVYGRHKKSECTIDLSPEL
jgi:hypothetical protein